MRPGGREVPTRWRRGLRGRRAGKACAVVFETHSDTQLRKVVNAAKHGLRLLAQLFQPRLQ